MPLTRSASVFFMVAAMTATCCVVPVHGAAFTQRLVSALPIFGDFGDFVEYYLFAEENAPLTPVPVIEIINTLTGVREPMVQTPIEYGPSPKADRYTIRDGVSHTLTHTETFHVFRSVSRTIQTEQRASISWFVKSAPFGALSAVGPQRFYPNENSQFPLDGLRFRTAGRYEVNFNVSLLTGENFHFNRTIHVQRQPNAIAHTTTVAGYNGSAFFPAPSAQLRNFLGGDVRSSTASVFLEFQAVPPGATVLGTLRRNTEQTGEVSFPSIVPTLPGSYTFRLRATLSDGSTLATPSQRVIVERALPVQIIVEQEITGIARFRFFTQPIFSIRDSAGPSQDTRMYMNLSISNNNPDFSYEGYNTIATLSGVTGVLPVDYRYTFTDLSIDLPGNYEITASLTLPTGDILATQLIVRLANPPTFEIPSPFIVNQIGTVTLYGQRPQVSEVRIMLALDEACDQPSSDQFVWRDNFPDAETNFSDIVPFNDQDSYVCMAVPSNPGFSPLIQRYLPQYDELFPLQFTFPVGGVDVCQALTASDAARYNAAGWESAASFRRYGCALKPPVSGTIPACSCPVVLTCDEMRHPSFTPPGLNIGQCVCCTTWVMIVAGCMCALFFAALLAVIYLYV